MERQAWSVRARRQAGERITRVRAETLRELLMLEAPPHPARLGIPTEPGPLLAKADQLAVVIAEWAADHDSI